MKILTSKGFRDFDGVISNGVKTVGEISIDGNTIRCTPEHRVFFNDVWKNADSFEDFKELNKEEVFDAVNVSDGHEYLTNGVPSHNCLYLDEFAHVDKDVEFWTSTFPTISSGKTTKVVITSTPRGMNLFYKLWTEAEQGKNPFKAFYFPWTENPTRDSKWEKEQLTALGAIKFKQEVSCSFLGSAGTLITGDKLQKLAFVDPIWVSETEDFKIYAKPDPTHKYILAADVSEGVDRDYSVISIFDVTERPFKHVAKYRNNQIPPEMFVDVIAKLGKKYNEALAIIETNSIGVNVAKDLWLEYEYENIVRSVERESGAKVSYGGQSKLGVKTTKATKRIGCSTLKSLIETDTLITNDFEAISELSTFISQNSSWGAEEGKYDDVVMSMVLFAWFTQQQAFEDYMSGAMNSVLRKARQDQEWGMPDIQFTDGIEDDGFDNTMFAPPVSRGSDGDAEILHELF